MSHKKVGRPRYYEDAKRKRTICVTDATWEKVRQLAGQKGLSVSEWLEQMLANIETQKDTGG